MSDAKQPDPLVAFSFALEIDNVNVGMFKSVSGLESSIEVTEVRQSDNKGRVHLIKVPGQVKYGDITFSRGMTKDNALYDWYDEITKGNYSKNIKTGSVILYAQDGTESARWNLEGCWPSGLKSNGLEAGQSEVLIEEMTFTVNRIERVKK